MKKIITVTGLLLSSVLCRAQVPNDSLHVLLEDIFSVVKQYSVYHDAFDWQGLHTKVFARIDTAHAYDDLIPAIRLIYRSLSDKHGAVILNGHRIGMNEKSTITISPVIRAQFNNGVPKIKTLRLPGDYGYIRVPGVNYDPQKTAAQAQEFQDSLCSLNPSTLKGLIVDLRLNGGGNMYPMMAGLNQVLGDGKVGAFCNLQGQTTQSWNIKNGAIYLDTFVALSVQNKCSVAANLKVVVLLSPITASSGEMLAIAMKGRPNTTFIGETTAGYTTSNQGPFTVHGQTVFVASGFVADKLGNIYKGPLTPDIEIIEGDDFDNLTNDKKMAAALNWLKGN